MATISSIRSLIATLISNTHRHSDSPLISHPSGATETTAPMFGQLQAWANPIRVGVASQFTRTRLFAQSDAQCAHDLTRMKVLSSLRTWRVDEIPKVSHSASE